MNDIIKIGLQKLVINVTVSLMFGVTSNFALMGCVVLLGLEIIALYKSYEYKPSKATVFFAILVGLDLLLVYQIPNWSTTTVVLKLLNIFFVLLFSARRYYLLVSATRHVLLDLSETFRDKHPRLYQKDSDSEERLLEIIEDLKKLKI